MPAGAALLIVTTPVAATTVTVPVNPAEAVAVTLLMLTLSLGAALGVTERVCARSIVVAVYVPSVGGVFAATFTVKLACAIAPPASVTVNTMLFAPTVAAQSAVMFAAIVPLVFVMLVIVMPAGTVVAVTTRLLAEVSISLTVAIFATVPALPCCLLSAAAAVIAGGALSSLLIVPVP